MVTAVVYFVTRSRPQAQNGDSCELMGADRLALDPEAAVFLATGAALLVVTPVIRRPAAASRTLPHEVAFGGVGVGVNEAFPPALREETHHVVCVPSDAACLLYAERAVEWSGY